MTPLISRSSRCTRSRSSRWWKRGAGGKLLAVAVFVRIVGDDGDALDAFGAHLAGDHVDGQAALVRLAAGHGDGVVVEDLVGDVGVGGRARSGSPARRNGCRCRRRDSGRCDRAWRTAPGRSTARPRRPSAVKPMVARSIHSAMKWQPMPAPAIEPSGTLVDELCGQPEQKKGVREPISTVSASIAWYCFSRSHVGGDRPRPGR